MGMFRNTESPLSARVAFFGGRQRSNSLFSLSQIDSVNRRGGFSVLTMFLLRLSEDGKLRTEPRPLDLSLVLSRRVFRLAS